RRRHISSFEVRRLLPFAQRRMVGPFIFFDHMGPVERFIEWNFVSSSKERIAQAKADWRAGRMKLPDLDNAECVPLPPDPPPQAEALSSPPDPDRSRTVDTRSPR